MTRKGKHFFRVISCLPWFIQPRANSPRCASSRLRVFALTSAGSAEDISGRLLKSLLACSLFLAIPAFAISAEPPVDQPKIDAAVLTIDRIYGGDEFKTESFGDRWLEDGSAFTTLEDSPEHKGHHDIVRHDPTTGEKEVIVSAAELIPAGESAPLKIEDYAWSKSQTKLLIYTNSKRVWRQNSRGDYWVLDRSARQLRKLGGDAAPSALMFAKFSPTEKHVAYLRDRNIYIEDLFDHSVRRLTETPSEDIINGTGDWVYEEEFGLRDGFKWSPDGASIAYQQIDTTDVQKFPLVNNTDSLYPKVTWFAYPKVGQKNPACRVGVVRLSAGSTHWIALPGDSRDHYVPVIDWAGSSHELLLQQFNRLQNRNRLFLVTIPSETSLEGNRVPILTEADDAWVDAHDELTWLNEGKQFAWISDRDGWRHVYIVSRDGSKITLATPGDYDVIRLLKIDEANGWLYFIASPDAASQRFLFKGNLDGTGIQRVTPSDQTGTHDYQISKDAKFAIHRASSADQPPVESVITLPDHQPVRALKDNAKLADKLAKLKLAETEFLQVDIGDGVTLDGWCIKPADLDPAKKYPLLVYVYGEPAGTTVVDRWGGSSWLWHSMLAQRGYVVMSFDNRGTKAPRGRAWRKSIYQKIGIIPPQDQAAAVKAVLKQRSYLDASRVGIWGWSGGGSSSLHAIFKYPKLYSTAIAIAPVPNQRYYDTIYQERYMGLPETNVEGFREGSPINFAKNLEGNLLLIHGTGDDNCHYQTTEMLIDELIAHNKQFSMMAYPNRTHSIKERKNTTRHLRDLMTRYLLDNLPAGAR
ncbi:MAG: S9 family peptidase [Planctomycetota bacterium]|nr:S9 family peptidase [Planctomycetota bacterium]MDA0921135.1 S9 family peptidase [Planctomycetota bacterium]